jgi:hypothetical protein
MLPFLGGDRLFDEEVRDAIDDLVSVPAHGANKLVALFAQGGPAVASGTGKHFEQARIDHSPTSR